MSLSKLDALRTFAGTMKILIAGNTLIPVSAYGSVERVIWWLGKALTGMGHEVTFLVKKGSSCPFARVLPLDEKETLAQQIPEGIDLVHFHFLPSGPLERPHLITCHENCGAPTEFDRNTVFLSHNHALRHGGSVFVHNGIDLDDYGAPDVDNRRMYFHFLGKAAWRVKNVRGAIDIAEDAGERLHVIGGSRVNFRMGLRVTLSPHVRFHGMLGGDGKNAIISASKGLLFPAIWHEPFGLGIVESLYFGCPIFGTPFGALPEILGSSMNGKQDRRWNGRVEAVHAEFGFLSVKKNEIAEALKEAGSFDRQKCRDYVAAHFTAKHMAAAYLKLYEQVLEGKPLHQTPPCVTEADELPNKVLSLE
jgi:Glycosyl transferases group 1